MFSLSKYTLRRMYIKGSLKNIDLNGDRKPDGFQFSFKNPIRRIYLYALYDINLFVDDERIDPSKIRFKTKGRTFSLNDFVKSNHICMEGDEITIIAERGGGLPRGEELRIRLSVLAAGWWASNGGEFQLVDALDRAS